MGGIGCLTSLFTDYSVERTLDVLVELGYDAIELNCDTDLPNFSAHVTADTPPQRRDAIRQAIEDSGLFLSSLCVHHSLMEADPRQRAAALDLACRSIDLAVDLGTDIVHIASGMMTRGHGEQEHWPWMADAARRCVEYGREKGVRVAIEAGVFPGLLVWNTESVLKLLDLAGCADLYVNFDPSHYQPAGDDCVATFRRLRDRIIHVHAKDGAGKRDTFSFPALNDGDVDWAGLCQVMIDTDYRGVISVEYEAHFFASGYDKDPLGAARQSKAFLDDVFADWLDRFRV